MFTNVHTYVSDSLTMGSVLSVVIALCVVSRVYKKHSPDEPDANKKSASAVEPPAQILTQQ